MLENLRTALDAAGIPVRENEPLSAHCTFKIGGPADLFVQPKDNAQLCTAVALCRAQQVPYYLLGNGSNILFEDAGFRGAVLDISAQQTDARLLSSPDAEEILISAPAGLKLSALCNFAWKHSCTGLESEYYDILGVPIPSTSIPVSPGRNLAVVLETAAINNRQKKMGYNAAKELLIRLGLEETLD